MPNASIDDITHVSSGYAAAWQKVLNTGTKVMALTDNPVVPASAARCLGQATQFDAQTCAFSRAQAFPVPDQHQLAAAKAPAAALIRTDTWFCTEGFCPMVAGGVVTYRDSHHITASYSRTLAPYLARAIDDAIDGDHHD